MLSRIAATGAFLGALFFPTTASAAEDGADDDAQADSSSDADSSDADDAADDGKFHLLDFMTFGVGIQGQVGVAILDKPDNQNIGGVSYTQNSDYPGFVGVAAAVGPVFDFRFFGYGGIEVAFLFGSASGSAELEHTDNSTSPPTETKYNIEIGQSETHIPLLFKGAIPSQWATPFIFIGPEFVLASDGACTGECENNPGLTDYDAEAESYTALAFGLGIEINLPIPKADIRLPVSLRGNVNPSVSSERDDRATHQTGTVGGVPNLSRETFNTAWKFGAHGSFGLSWHF